MDSAQSCPRWAKWAALSVILTLCVIYAVFLQTKLAALLALAKAVKSSKDDPRVWLSIFGLVVFAAPLAVVPTGAVLVSGALTGYILGLPGLALAWPGFSLGLIVVFAFARLASSREDTEQAKKSGSPAREADAAHNSLPTFLQGRHTRALLGGILRLVREQPKRSAILMTFASHSPLTQFIFGWATDIRWTDSVLACLVDGVKITVPLLKGMAIGDVMELMTAKDENTSCWNDGTHCAGLIMKVCVSVAVGVVFLLIARSILREIHEMDEEEEENRAFLCSDSESVNEGAQSCSENEAIGTYGSTKP